MRILAVETSCDETAIALIEAEGGLKNPRFKILKNLVASQIKIHKPYGGVVPSLAKREHLKNLPILWKQIAENKSLVKGINLIIVTVGPGLEPCLWTGINFAKELYPQFKIGNQKLKLTGVSHLDGHLYSVFLNPTLNSQKLFPAVALIISGGHTVLLLVKNIKHYKKLGETRDDAVGECFDKVGRLLNLSYPAGPEIEKLAKKGNPQAVNFPRPMIYQKNYDFSFSGLKTAVLYFLRDNIKNSKKKSDITASFQVAAFDVLINKTIKAAKEFKAKSIVISGGVAANKTIRKEFRKAIRKEKLNLKFVAPGSGFCTDNAAMIGLAGYIKYLQNKNRRLIAQGNMTI